MDKILVVDDSIVQAKFLKNCLQNDYEVVICPTARGGLELANSGEFSLILLDIVMPDMDGFAMLSQLKESEITKMIPVIMITGLADDANEERGLQLGVVDYITKPFKPLIVKARVDTHIKLHHYQTQLRQQTMLDRLTGIANRQFYETNSIVKWQEATRFQLPITICMMDIDFFKLYNDNYGHPAGDNVLQTIAQSIAGFFHRATDFFARYGGEEFVTIQLGDEASAAYEYWQTIRKAVENLHIPHQYSSFEQVTVSVGGVTLRPNQVDQYNNYLQIADNMLYKAKKGGRNMVVWSNAGQEEWWEKAPQ